MLSELRKLARAPLYILLQVAELRKLEHRCLLGVSAMVLDPTWMVKDGESTRLGWSERVGLLSEMAECSLAALLDQVPIRIACACALHAFCTLITYAWYVHSAFQTQYSFDQAPVRLTWDAGLLGIATDVAAGLDHLHGLGLHHGRLFLFNIMITSKWRAKLSEYHLDPYLAAARDGQGAEGEHSLSASHGERGGQLPSPFFLSPERFGGRLPAMQSQLKPAWLEAAGRIPGQPWANAVGLLGKYEGGASKEKLSTVETLGKIKRARFDRLRGGKKAAELAAVEQAKAADTAAAAALRAQIVHDVQQANQRADVWAFGCLLASLALHDKLTRRQSSKR